MSRLSGGRQRSVILQGGPKKAEPQTRDHILLSNLNRFLRAWPTHGSKTEKVHETITFLLVTLPNIHRLKKSLTDSAINLS